MKKIFLILLLLVGIGYAQYNPYNTSGWDAPYTYTGDTLASPTWSSSNGYYGLGIFSLGSNPGGWLNRNFWKVDSLMESLVVYTDTTQLRVVSDTLIVKFYGLPLYANSDSAKAHGVSPGSFFIMDSSGTVGVVLQ